MVCVCGGFFCLVRESLVAALRSSEQPDALLACQWWRVPDFRAQPPHMRITSVVTRMQQCERSTSPRAGSTTCCLIVAMHTLCQGMHFARLRGPCSVMVPRVATPKLHKIYLVAGTYARHRPGRPPRRRGTNTSLDCCYWTACLSCLPQQLRHQSPSTHMGAMHDKPSSRFTRHNSEPVLEC